jgi:hypothetical protein
MGLVDAEHIEIGSGVKNGAAVSVSPDLAAPAGE